MGSDKSFNDARVLRSDDTVLSVKQLRMLVANLETGEHNLGDLAKLQDIDDKITEILGEYSEELDRLTDASNDAFRTYGQDSMEFREAAIALSNYITDYGGAKAQDVIITTSEWDWIKTRWAGNTKLVGTRNVRGDILAVNDVVRHAKGVKFVSNGTLKAAWIAGEAHPFAEPAPTEA